MPSSPRVPRVLIADDQSINRKLTTRRLQMLGLAADAVESGLEAVEAWSRGGYDLIFMDCHMPQMDGFEATEEIRRREAGAGHTPIVALTASAVGPERDRCLACGMDDYVMKPISDDDLGRIIRRYVLDAQPAIDDVTTANLQQITNDDAVLKEVIDLYFADAALRMDEIRKAIAARDSGRLVTAAHALKSCSGNVGATRVRELCNQMEVIGRADGAARVDGLLAQLESEYERANRELQKKRSA